MKEFIREFMALVSDLRIAARDRLADATAQARLRDRAVRAVIVLAFAGALPLALSVPAALLGMDRIAEALVFLFGVASAFVILISMLAYAAVFELLQRVPGIRRLFELIAAGALAFFVVVFTLYRLPTSPPVVMTVLLGATGLGFFAIHYGMGPDPRRAYRLFTVVFVLTLARALLAAAFPATFDELARALGSTDARLAGAIRPGPTRLRVATTDELDRMVFFDDGQAVVFHSRSVTGEIELFDSAGTHPVHGTPLAPVTPEVVGQLRAALQKRERGGPMRIEYGEEANLRFFDEDGNSLVWYAELADGGVDLFDGPGAHPVHRTALRPVTPDVVARIQELAREGKARVSAAKLEEENAELRRAYTNEECSSSSGYWVLVSRSGQLDQAATEHLAGVLRGASTCLTQAFASSKHFSEGMSGDSRWLARLGVPKTVEGVVLVELGTDVQSVKAAGTGMSKARAEVVAMLFLPGESWRLRRLTTADEAVGFDAQEAARTSVHKVLDELGRQMRSGSTVAVSDPRTTVNVTETRPSNDGRE